KESEKRVEEWQSNVALLTINVHINTIKSRFKRNRKINEFLDGVKQDILKNISLFIANEDSPKMVSQGPRQETPKPWLNYRVNLFIDNSKLEGAPVVMDSNYS